MCVCFFFLERGSLGRIYPQICTWCFLNLMLLSCFDSISFGHWTIIAQFYDSIVSFGFWYICSHSRYLSSSFFLLLFSLSFFFTCSLFYLFFFVAMNTSENTQQTFTYTKLTRNTHNWILHSKFIIWSFISSSLTRFSFFLFFSPFFCLLAFVRFVQFSFVRNLYWSAQQWWRTLNSLILYVILESKLDSKYFSLFHSFLFSVVFFLFHCRLFDDR